MKTNKTYRALLIAGAFFTALFFYPSQPAAAAPPGVHFHASFHVGTSFYTPVVSYSARIRMFSYPSVSAGYLYDPFYYDPWYGGGGYYYNSGYGSFSVTFSFGYPSYYYSPAWYYYPVAYYPPVYYYPPVHIWPYPGTYYSYHYGWHSGCGYYGYPYYDRHYHSYGSRSAEYTAAGYRPASQAAMYSSRAGHSAAERPDHYGVRSRGAVAGTEGRPAHRNTAASRSQEYGSHASRGNAGTLRRTASHSRNVSASTRSAAQKRMPGRYSMPASAATHRQGTTTARRSPGVTARRSTVPAAAARRSSPSYVSRASTAPYRHTPQTATMHRNVRRSATNPSVTSRRNAPAPVKSMHAAGHQSRPAGVRGDATSSRRTSSGRSAAPRRR